MKAYEIGIVASIGALLMACESAPRLELNPPVKAQYGATVGAGTVTAEIPTEIRAYAKNTEGKRTEVPAKCTISGVGLQAEFTTPTTLIMPKTDGKPSALAYKCTYQNKAYETTLNPKLLTGRANNSTGNVFADVIVAVGTAAIAAARNDWVYEVGNPNFE